VTVRASILIPTHDRAQTLAIATASALGQTVEDVEVLIIGDGVTDAVRRGANELALQDSRVRFFDNPTGANHGETYRHDAIIQARGGAIFYLCDDDLLMKNHVSDLLELLETHDFVQSLNGFVTTDGELRRYPADLSDPETVRLHLSDELSFNSVSLTGTAHSREFYLSMNDPWTTTPEGFWPDHYQARKFLRAPGCRSATSRRMTALQFPTLFTDRENWPEEDRVAEMMRWRALTVESDGQERVDQLVNAANRSLVDLEYRTVVELAFRSEQYREQAARDEAAVAETEAQCRERQLAHEAKLAQALAHHHEREATLQAELDDAHEQYREMIERQRLQLDELLASNSWRVTAPARWLRRRIGTRPGG